MYTDSPFLAAAASGDIELVDKMIKKGILFHSLIDRNKFKEKALIPKKEEIYKLHCIQQLLKDVLKWQVFSFVFLIISRLIIFYPKGLIQTQPIKIFGHQLTVRQ
jgi:hypothetical protein